ncbi:hypothetical protein BaRGS_00023491 [Batillaria attramentaria]|uniref:Uncharacterized protein n=1 Tax=Batillaria attramentaria TaxID=370345 RepID=A0ABD0KE74_9CAEN
MTRSENSVRCEAFKLNMTPRTTIPSVYKAIVVKEAMTKKYEIAVTSSGVACFQLVLVTKGECKQAKRHKATQL